MEDLKKTEKIKTQIPDLIEIFSKKPHIEVALSGGLDSVSLLHFLHTQRAIFSFKLSSVHVHHGLQEMAEAWCTFCERLCAQWEIPLRIERVLVQKTDASLEAAARTARYAAFSKTNADILALAHHADDQAETVLLNTLRGGGVAQLAAMPRIRTLQHSHAQLWRPFLAISRDELDDYARHFSLPFCLDPSNEMIHFRRNFLRNELFPHLKQRYPDYRQQLLRTAETAQDELAILTELDSLFLNHIEFRRSFFVGELKNVNAAWARRRVAAFFRFHAQRVPKPSAIAAFYERAIAGEAVNLREKHWELFAERGQIFIWEIKNNPDYSIDYECSAERIQNIHLPEHLGILRLTFKNTPPTSTMLNIVPVSKHTNIDVHGKTQSAWTQLHQKNIPRRFRPYVPAVIFHGKCVAIGHYWQSDECPFECEWTQTIFDETR